MLQKINYKKIDYKNKNLYENKDNKKINDKTYIDSTQKNENKNNYNRYINYSNNISRKDNNINNTINLYTNTLEKNYGQSRYNIPISLKKRNEQKNIINYTQTEQKILLTILKLSQAIMSFITVKILLIIIIIIKTKMKIIKIIII